VKSVVLSILIAAVAASGCATKKYVSREVGEVNQKVEVLTGEMEKTQERVKRSEVRIDEVGKDVQDVRGTAQTALTRATEAERAAKGKLIYTVTISNDQVTFPVNRSEVSDEAKQIVDDAIAQLKAENRGVYFEIEGHTDSSGPDEYNVRLGYDRAFAVRNYMHDHHEIALNRIEVISYGESKPVEDNKNKTNRAKNRRVVIRVLE
jgi:outer membrane protein OmpA-like peptidoglycan-associated protein